jgi:hypothetical protein
MVRPAGQQRVRSRPQPLTATAPEGASATQQPWHGGPRVRSPRIHPFPPAGSVTMRRLRPAPATTRRWPPTGSACRPATRCRNAGSPRCSGAHPAAGREPEWPMHDKHRRSQTHRAPRSRLNDMPWRHLGEGTRRHNAPLAQVPYPPLAQVPSCPENTGPASVGAAQHLNLGCVWRDRLGGPVHELATTVSFRIWPQFREGMRACVG